MLQITLTGEISTRYQEFVDYCHQHHKTPDDRISELMLGDLFMHEYVKNGM